MESGDFTDPKLSDVLPRITMDCKLIGLDDSIGRA